MSAQIKITTQVGRHTVEIVSDNVKSAIEATSFFGELPTKAPDGSDTVLCYRKVKRKTDGKEFKYYSLRNTGKELLEIPFGEHLAGGSLFAKKSEGWKKVTFNEVPSEESGSDGVKQEDAPW